MTIVRIRRKCYSGYCCDSVNLVLGNVNCSSTFHDQLQPRESRACFLDPCLKHRCQYYGKCLALNPQKVECVCPVCVGGARFQPYCGSDGHTYATKCQLERSSCLQKREITIARRDVCGKPRSSGSFRENEFLRANIWRLPSNVVNRKKLLYI